MTLSRLLAYPFVAFMALGVIGLVLAFSLGSKPLDFRGVVAFLFFLVWWSWAGISVYLRYIKKPREDRKRQRAEALAYVEKTISPGLSLSVYIEALRKNQTLVGAPRHRPSADPSFDTMVELETHGFILSLFCRDGVIQSWSIR